MNMKGFGWMEMDLDMGLGLEMDMDMGVGLEMGMDLGREMDLEMEMVVLVPLPTI